VTDKEGRLLKDWVNTIPERIFIKSHIQEIEPFVSHVGTNMTVKGFYFDNGGVEVTKKI